MVRAVRDPSQGRMRQSPRVWPSSPQAFSLVPANMFLTTRDGSPLVKVLDFGIAKAKALAGSAQQATMTMANTMMGSPGMTPMLWWSIWGRTNLSATFYMALEQIRDASKVDARSDVSYERVGRCPSPRRSTTSSRPATPSPKRTWGGAFDRKGLGDFDEDRAGVLWLEPPGDLPGQDPPAEVVDNDMHVDARQIGLTLPAIVHESIYADGRRNRAGVPPMCSSERLRRSPGSCRRSCIWVLC